MRLQVHFRGIHPVDDAETRRHAEDLAEKLERIVEFYRPDQKRLRLVIEGTKQGYSAGGSVTVPHKALYADAKAETLTEALDQCFGKLRKELLKHRAVVRKEYLKKRKFAWQEDLIESHIELETEARKSKEGFKDRFLPLLRNLYRTARRRVVLHQLAGELEPSELRPDDIIKDLVWWQYESFQQDGDKKPDKNMSIKLQQVLRDRIESYISKREMAPVEISEDGPEIESARFQIAEDETDVFHEPPESLRWDDILNNDDKDHSFKDGDEPTTHQTQLIYRTISKLDKGEREAYVLHSIEGWDVGEIAEISHMPVNEVGESIEQSEKFIKHSLGIL
jgi:DNA-directed RNA polymerase specialized sigma24 family protein/ribosome-associated translation inhibitor RaiA